MKPYEESKTRELIYVLARELADICRAWRRAGLAEPTDEEASEEAIARRMSRAG